MSAIEYYKRGFEDCAELVEKRLYGVESLEEAKKDLKRVLATVKEKRLAQLEQELGL